MTDLDDEFGQFAQLAVETAAAELGISPLTLARRLNGAEIARLIILLNAALRHVEHPALRHRIEDLLTAVTDGRMPAAGPETELDWALKVTGRRREDRTRRRSDTDEMP
jgi:hypothetical protein